MANIRVVSSLNDVATELQNLQITDIARANDVQFQLDEETPLQDAAEMKMKIRPGKHEFILVNPELLECKYRAKVELETSFNSMLDASMEQIDQELQPIEEGIAALRVLVRYNDHQIPQNGPPLDQRNRGVQHVIYPCPPFPIEPRFEHDTHHQRVPYQNAYTTQQERDAAAARDRRAQRAVWEAKLRILEARQSILKELKASMLSKMRSEFKMMMEQRSNLGTGYAEYAFPSLA